MSSGYFPVHAHSKYSVLDGMGDVGEMVGRVAELGQPGLVLSDHGTMAGTVQLYKACRKAGIVPFPGSEFYVVRDVNDPDTRDKRYHLGLLALDFEGYQALTKLTTLSWTKDRFYRKPLIDLSDLAFLHDEGYADHIAVTTGCYFGLVINEWQGAEPQVHADNMIRMLSRWFPHLYVELQNHGIDHPDGADDLDISAALYAAALAHGLPVVIGGDSHYIDAAEQPVHDLMKDICYFGDGEDNQFPGGPYHLMSSQEAMLSFPKSWRGDLLDGHRDLLAKNTLAIPALDNYKFHVPRMVKEGPEKVLADRVWKGLADKGINDIEHLARAQEELRVIDAMRMSNYFLLIQDHVTDWCREQGIIVNSRGSVNGSLVAYAQGITNVDPLVWGTSFDRFLSLDRMKPPDIDIDVDYRGRQRLIDHLRAVFPTMVQVGTYAQIGITTQEDETTGSGEDKGSVFVQYMAAMRRKNPKFDGKVRREHRQTLNHLADTPVYKSMGTNAAGFILPGDDLPIDKYLPMSRIISSDTLVTQYSKDDVEALGYMKMDILGLRALQTLNGTLTRIGKQPNEWDWIPYDDPAACKTLRSGKCTGIFQYEGWTSEHGGKELGIRSTLDTILGLALYRPALINGGQKDQYLANRGKAKAKQQRLPALFDHVVKDTAGVPLFQEQILEILKAIGMAFQDYNDLMTAIKASNGFIQNAAGTFQRIKPIFYDLCEDAGLGWQESDDAWNAVIGFTEYGFNRAHATSYGLMSYNAAYLKTHYPLEYMASLLDVWAGTQKEPLYVAEARRLGFSIVRADINHSGASWDIDPTRSQALRKGLVTIKGIGWEVGQVIEDERKANGKFTSVEDFLNRTPARPVTRGKDWKKGVYVGVTKTLIEAGALRSVLP